MHVLAVAGSLRRDSWNKRLLEAAVECPSLTATVYGDLGAVPPFNEDLESEDPASVRSFRREVAAADGLLVSTPEYNQSLPGVLKNAIDWLSRPYGDSCLVGKPVAVIGATTGSWGTRIAQKDLRHALWAAEALVLPHPALYVRNAAMLFDDSGRLTDDRTRDSLCRLLSSFEDWIRTLQR